MSLELNENVQNFIAASSRPKNELLPASIEIKMNTDLVDGELGVMARDGYVAFCLSAGQYRGNRINASYVVVSDIYGNIQNVRVGEMYTVTGGTEEYSSRFEALKPYNTSTLILARKSLGRVNSTTDLNDDVLVLWNWVTGHETLLVSIEESIGSHDIQYQSTQNTIYTLGKTTADIIYEIDIETNQVTWEWDWQTACESTPHISMENKAKYCDNWVAHFNHIQLDGDTNQIYISARDLNAIIKVDRQSGKVVWQLGGPMNNFNLTSMNGTKGGRQSGLFYGQHNVEKKDNVYIMFDNGVDIFKNSTFQHNSRYLTMTVDEKTMTASEEWSFSTGMMSHTFGDADKLPSGNIIGCAWPNVVRQNAEDLQYDAVIYEVTHKHQIAWELLVRSHASARGEDYGNVVAEAPAGWAFYSVERFYARPLLGSLDYDADSGVLTFEAWNTHRTADKTTASVTMTCTESGTTVMSKTFDFEEFWFTTKVHLTFDTDNDCPDEVHEVVVTNSWGISANLKFNQPASEVLGTSADDDTNVNAESDDTVTVSASDDGSYQDDTPAHDKNDDLLLSDDDTLSANTGDADDASSESNTSSSDDDDSMKKKTPTDDTDDSSSSESNTGSSDDDDSMKKKTPSDDTDDSSSSESNTGSSDDASSSQSSSSDNTDDASSRSTKPANAENKGSHSKKANAESTSTGDDDKAKSTSSSSKTSTTSSSSSTTSTTSSSDDDDDSQTSTTSSSSSSVSTKTSPVSFNNDDDDNIFSSSSSITSHPGEKR